MTIRLTGMTRRHPRLHAPLVACSRIWRERTGVSIAWDQRQMRDFETFPLEELAAAYDLIAIAPLHIGPVAEAGCILPLDEPGREGALADLAARSIGPAYRSYERDGRQWALPIDAAAQVLAYRPDRIATPPRSLDQVLDLAAQGRVSQPMKSPHPLLLLYALSERLGESDRVPEGSFAAGDSGRQAWRFMLDLFPLLSPEDIGRGALATLDLLSTDDSPIDVVPLVPGYVNYTQPNYRPRRVAFSNMPTRTGEAPLGSTMSGTGIAVSARARHREAAVEFAYWLASEAVQRGPFVLSGGQPSHRAAWDDDAANAHTSNFFRATRATLEGSRLQRRHDGYARFRYAASDRIVRGLAARESAETVLPDLDRLFAATRRRRAAGVQA